MNQGLGQYTFLPWLRQGMAASISETDTLGENTGSSEERPEVKLKLTLQGRRKAEPEGEPIDGTIEEVVSKIIKLYGPGDIGGFQKGAIIRTEPPPNVGNFEYNFLSFIEFYDEDLPWRYSPASANGERLTPWLSLVVLKRSEYDSIEYPSDRLPFFFLDSKIGKNAFHDLKSHWAWAHVQLNSLEEGTAIEDHLKRNPDLGLSRLICPRRLEKNEVYTAFLIPTYETGRIGGLGDEPKGIKAQQFAWSVDEDSLFTAETLPNTFPIYFHWEFQTGALGDFETLVEALDPFEMESQHGTMPMDISSPGYGLNPETSILGFEGVFLPPNFTRQIFPTPDKNRDVEAYQKLEKLLNLNKRSNPEGIKDEKIPDNPFFGTDLGKDPVIVPPIYGQWHAQVDRVPKGGESEDEWLRTLNMDFRFRTAAGIGSQVIRKHQAYFVQKAWERLGSISDANKKIRNGELAIEVQKVLWRKHFLQLDDEQQIAITRPMHSKIFLEEDNEEGERITLLEKTEQSRIPPAVLSLSLRKIMRPGRKINQVIANASQDSLSKDLMQNFNKDRNENPLVSASPKVEPINTVSCKELTFEGPKLEVRPEQLQVSASGGKFIISVTSNVNWQVSKSAAWVKLNSTSGEKDGNFEVEIDASELGRTRETRILISDGAELNRSIRIFQDWEPTLRVSQLQCTGYGTSTQRIKVTSNTKWRIKSITSNVSVNISPTSGSSNRELIVTFLEIIAGNSSDGVRSGEILFETDATTKKIQYAIGVLRYLIPSNCDEHDDVGGSRGDGILSGRQIELNEGREAGEHEKGSTVDHSIETSIPRNDELNPDSFLKSESDLRLNRQEFLENVCKERPEEPALPTQGPELPIGQIIGLMDRVLDPRFSLGNRIRKTIYLLKNVEEDEVYEPLEQVEKITAGVGIQEPMFNYLKDYSEQAIIPNIDKLPHNSLTVLQANFPFIEAYMAGLNFEMARELLWREFPTTLRETFFQQFWEKKDRYQGEEKIEIEDLFPLDKWSGSIGSNHKPSFYPEDDQYDSPTNSFLALIMRGDLFKKYPNTLVFAVEANRNKKFPKGWVGQISRNVKNDKVKFPFFQASIQPDIVIFGFTLTINEALSEAESGDIGNGASPGGWYFVFKERPGQAKFGLDIANENTGDSEVLENWQELTWEMAIAHSDSNLNFSRASILKVENDIGEWGKNAADTAYILMQNPIIYARHADELIKMPNPAKL